MEPSSTTHDPSTEEWRHAMPDYEVSSLGRFRRSTPEHGTQAGRIRALTVNSRGYRRAGVRIDGKYLNFQIAPLVAAAFIGPRPVGMEVNHINGIRTDNRVENLVEYVTRSENHKHAFRLGLHDVRGEKSPTAKLREMSVRVIRRLRGRLTQREIGRFFGVGPDAVWSVLKGRTWSHVHGGSRHSRTSS